MARIRSIKPETFTSETVSSLSLAARWTFVGLWTHVDDEGRARDNAKIIRGALWPNEDETVSSKDVEGHLCELEDAEMICRYAAGGVRYLHVVNFLKHQSINRPTPSKLPPCPHSEHPEPSRRSHEGSQHGSPGANEPSLNPHGGLSDGPKRTDRAAAEVRTGQNTLTDDSLNPHGALTPRAHAREVEQGSGTGNRESAAELKPGSPAQLTLVPGFAANEPPQHEQQPGNETEGQRINRLARVYADLVPLSAFKAVQGVVRMAVRAADNDGGALYGDEQITAGLETLAKEKRPLTATSLRVAIEGFPQQRAASGHAPYQNPTDQSVYFGAIS